MFPYEILRVSAGIARHQVHVLKSLEFIIIDPTLMPKLLIFLRIAQNLIPKLLVILIIGHKLIPVSESES